MSTGYWGPVFETRHSNVSPAKETVVQYNTLPQEIEVLVLNTESRHLNFDQAYEKTKTILKMQKLPRWFHLFIKKKKKKKSRFSIKRKHQRVRSKRFSIWANKRFFLFTRISRNESVVIDGHLYIEDVFGIRKRFANDPYEPVTESNVMQRPQSEAGSRQC